MYIRILNRVSRVFTIVLDAKEDEFIRSNSPIGETMVWQAEDLDSNPSLSIRFSILYSVSKISSYNFLMKVLFLIQRYCKYKYRKVKNQIQFRRKNIISIINLQLSLATIFLDPFKITGETIWKMTNIPWITKESRLKVSPR